MGYTLRHLDGLSQVPSLPEESRRSAWRQAFAELASQAADHVPVPLEGMNAPHLEDAVRWALANGLVDDLAWLSPEHGSAALYELAGALRPGAERRELGRRVLERLMQGNAATFVGLARRLALGSRRGLSGAGILSRVALVLDLPVGFSTGADGLALALLTRPDLERAWAVDPSTGSLPSRRLAARLLERAACEVLRRPLDRLGSVVSLFERPDIQSTWARLLADREPLVWRHVASARGLLSQQVPMFEGEIVRDLDPSMSPTEWRRAAVSAAASIAVDPDIAVERCRSILTGRVLEKDPGVAGAMLLGVSRAVEKEPEAAEFLIEQILRTGGLDAIEGLWQLRQEHVDKSVGAGAVPLALERLAEFSSGGDDGRAALIRALQGELASSVPEFSLRERVRAAVTAFVVEGAVAAQGKALDALGEAEGLLDRLLAMPWDTPEGRHETFGMLRELDHALLERSTLADLLALGAHPEASLVRFDGQLDRLADWLLRAEVAPASEDPGVTHFTLHLHRLRAMLHLVDGNPVVTASSSASSKGRKLRTARVLLDRVSRSAPSPLRRVLAASAARACDALLREELGELSDILIMVGDRVQDQVDLATMAEASMDPSMELVLQGFLRFLRGCQGAATGAATVPLEALDELVRSLPVLGSPRVEAFRSAIRAYSESVWALHSVRCLTQVAEGENGGAPCIPPFANASVWLARLAVGARRRMEEEGIGGPSCGEALHGVDAAVEHALRGNPAPLGVAVSEGIAVLRAELPLGMAKAAERALQRMVGLPLEMEEEAPFSLTRPRPQSVLLLPAWMPASRVLGGFYVIRLLDCGGVGSVFVVCRVEDRNQRRPLRFAMKVPEYGPDVAHTLSESEFLEMFRDEAGALLTIPQHPNLARFVTFDAGARPKPILVMELVEGPTLFRLIHTRVLDTKRALAILDGVAAGLETMHANGLGHLDVKPGNVILRPPEPTVRGADLDLSHVPRVSRYPQGPEAEATPVLVDFGLAGRKTRPGCATAEYGAPEVWGYVPEGYEPLPMPADVYAFACMVYETLTGAELFLGSNHLAVIASHVEHDGNPSGLAKLWKDPALVGLGQVLSRGLRRDPRARCSLSEMRWGLAQLGLGDLPWPVG